MTTQREDRGSLVRPLDITGEFPDEGYELWREVAEKSLKGKSLDRLVTKTHEGVPLNPVYGQETSVVSSGFPGQAPFTRGHSPLGNTKWRSGCVIDLSLPQAAAERLKDARSLGTNVIRLFLENGTSPARGVSVSTVEDLKVVTHEITDTDIPVYLDGGANSFSNAAALIAALDSGNLESAHHCLGCDPFGALAANGSLDVGLETSLEQMTALTAWTSKNAPGVHPITISSLPYHQSGATAVEELAFTAATAIEYLRALDSAGIEVERLPEFQLVFGIGRDTFMEIAKLRAARTLLGSVLQSCGVPAKCCSIGVHAITSERTMTRRDPWVNLLRVTVETFASSIGGADTITTLPFDRAIGQSSANAHRLAANTQTILREESHLARVVDPAGGSFFVEKLTTDLSQAAWELMQGIEAHGGMASFLCSGKARALVSEKARARDHAINNRKDPITGVSSFANLDEEKLVRPHPESVARKSRRKSRDQCATEAVDRLKQLLANHGWGPDVFAAAVVAMKDGASLEDLQSALKLSGQTPTKIEAFVPKREAERYEELRDLSDEHYEKSGVYPTVFLTNLGTIPEYKARTSFATSFLEAGGIRVIDSGGFASAAQAAEEFAASPASIAVICSSDAKYIETAADTAVALKTAGATHIMLAGRPGEHEEMWRRAGIDTFIYVGCDVLGTLVDLYSRLGVRNAG